MHGGVIGLPLQGRAGDVSANGQSPRLVMMMMTMMMMMMMKMMMLAVTKTTTMTMIASYTSPQTLPTSGHHLRLQPCRSLPPLQL